MVSRESIPNSNVLEVTYAMCGILLRTVLGYLKVGQKAKKCCNREFVILTKGLFVLFRRSLRGSEPVP